MAKYKCKVFNETNNPVELERLVNKFLKNNEIEIIHYNQSSTGRMDTTVTISIIYQDRVALS